MLIPISRRLRGGSFGDSTNEGLKPSDGQPQYWDTELANDVIPASGSTTFSVPSSVRGIQWVMPVRWVADGGKEGETTTQMLARAAAVASTTRASLPDIVSKSLDVLFTNGDSINDLSGLDVGSDVNATIAALVVRQRALLTYASPRIPYIIWTGIYGGENTTWSAARNAVLQNAIVQTWATSAALAAEFPNVVFLNPNGILSDNGVWRPGVNIETGSRFHLSAYGGYLLAKMQAQVLSELFNIRNNDEVVYDHAKDWFNPTGLAPNIKPASTASSAAGGGSAVIGSSSVTNGQWSQKITTTGNTVECVLCTFQNMKTWFSGKLAGTKWYFEVDIDAYDETGTKIPFRAQASAFLYDAANSANRFVAMGATPVDSARMCSPTITFDRDAVNLGSSSSIQVRVYPDRVGETTFVIQPPRIRLA